MHITSLPGHLALYMYTVVAGYSYLNNVKFTPECTLFPVSSIYCIL